MRITLPNTARALIALALAASAVGCAGGSGSQVPSPATTAATGHAPVTCPSVTGGASTFPSGASSDVPHPDNAMSASYLPVQAPGVKVLRFTTKLSLRDSVLFVLKRYPAAGYVLGRGDAEIGEADAPFSRQDVRGTTRLTAVTPCSTTWLVATEPITTNGFGNTPLLVPHSTSTASPLPFAP